jgi:hypothetical protein
MTTQLLLNTNLVRLKKAVLCANCELISEANNGHCAACDSQALLSLSRILGGPMDSDGVFAFAESALVADGMLTSVAFHSAA